MQDALDTLAFSLALALRVVIPPRLLGGIGFAALNGACSPKGEAGESMFGGSVKQIERERSVGTPKGVRTC